jgi:hypothetical protein
MCTSIPKLETIALSLAENFSPTDTQSFSMTPRRAKKIFFGMPKGCVLVQQLTATTCWSQTSFVYAPSED